MISILRVPKAAPIGWITHWLLETCVLPAGGRLQAIEEEDEFVLAVEGERPTHPCISGGWCDCGLRQGFCPRCLG